MYREPMNAERKQGMNKSTATFIAVCIVGLIGVWVLSARGATTGTDSGYPGSVSQETVRTRVTFGIDDGESSEIFQQVTASTPYEALKAIAAEKNLPLSVKQYEFGVFVEAIGDKKNTNETAWIYFVNGESGTVAADKLGLESGDRVEWKYIKPSIQ
jgi:hypothetical protein